MPTERFFRLPTEKAETIRRAAIEEFKRVPPEEASINKIIQAAEISRGSFYTYFEDKYDLLKWLASDYINNYRRFYVESLKGNDGNIWDVFEQVLVYTMQWAQEQGLLEIVGNLIKGNQFSENIVNPPVNNCEIGEANKTYAETMYRLVNKAYCELNFAEFEELLRLHMASLVISLKQYFTREKTMEEIEVSYRLCIRLLRHGASPEQKL